MKSCFDMEDEDKEAVSSPSVTTTKTEEHSKVILKNMIAEKNWKFSIGMQIVWMTRLKMGRMFLVLQLIYWWKIGKVCQNNINVLWKKKQ